MDLQFMLKSLPKLIAVLPMTLYLAFIALVIGLIAAVGIVIVRELKVPFFAKLFAILVSFVRGTPILVQLYVVYYGLPRLFLLLGGHAANHLPSILIAILAYAINAAANLSESIRSAYHSVDPRQYRAALSVGLTPRRAITRIVVPQAVINFIPNFSNVGLDLLKDTALVYNIGIIEIMGRANIVASFGFQYLETYLDALLIYLVVCWIIGKGLQLCEHALSRNVFA